MEQGLKREIGFTLVELIVTMAIAAILTAIAVPGYRQIVQRSNRTDATTALLKIAAAQEKFYMQFNTYATDAQRSLAPPAGLGVPRTDQDLYTLTIAPNLGGLVQGYIVTATPTAGKGQATDTNCATFRVTEQGARTALDSGGADNTPYCWK
jgi:type IV pilus assembly protein PilE